MAIRTIAEYALPILGVLAAAATAAPATAQAQAQASQPYRVRDRATSIANGHAPAACVSGAPASSSLDYAAVAALRTAGSYDVDESFASAHAVGSVMDLYISPDSDMGDYASFKCQYTCNGTPGCVSFFGRYVHVNSTTAHFECLSFGALLDEDAFTLDSENIANGGFNKLCN